MPVDSVGLIVDDYSRLIVFRDRDLFHEVLEANPHLVPVHGHTEQDEECFPGLYVAGVKVKKQPLKLELNLDARKILADVLQELRDKHKGVPE